MSKRTNNKNDKFIKFTIYAFIALIGVLIASIFIFNKIDPSLDYKSFETIDSYNAFPEMPEETYMVYWYSENCAACKQIKTDVLDFANENEQNLKVYFSDSSDTFGNPSIIRDPFKGTNLRATPTMVFVRDNMVIDLVLGSDQILILMQNVNNGTYQFLAN